MQLPVSDQQHIFPSLKFIIVFFVIFAYFTLILDILDLD